MVIAFAHLHLRNPDGPNVGRPMVLDEFQQAFILAVFDNPEHTNEAYLSVARRAGKTFVIAVVLLAFLVGPLAAQNADIASAANSREQAALVFNFMHKTLQQSPDLAGRWHAIPSSKTIVGLSKQTTYKALSADAKTGLGRGYRVLVHDEAGQIKAPSSDYVDMLRSSTAGGSQMLYLVVSTQAQDDTAYLSVQMDSAIRTNDPHAVVHLYTTEQRDDGKDLLDETCWIYSNPSLGKNRSVEDLRKMLRKAYDIPTQSSGARNLLLNQRISQDSLFMSPEVWRRNTGLSPGPDTTGKLILGVDLSLRIDLTAAVASWKHEDGLITLETSAFAPAAGIEQRQIRDKAPYALWAQQGHLQLVPGEVVEYEWICEYLKLKYEEVHTLCFDRYRIEAFKEAAKRTGFYEKVVVWQEVGQGYVSMAPRLDSFESAALKGRFRTSNHPVLNMAASQAFAISDPAGNRKLTKQTVEKGNRTSRIDALVAAIMASFPLLDGEVQEEAFDAARFIG
jgi:phage terminase large subunit-like protein